MEVVFCFCLQRLRNINPCYRGSGVSGKLSMGQNGIQEQEEPLGAFRGDGDVERTQGRGEFPFCQCQG